MITPDHSVERVLTLSVKTRTDIMDLTRKTVLIMEETETAITTENTDMVLTTEDTETAITTEDTETVITTGGTEIVTTMEDTRLEGDMEDIEMDTPMEDSILIRIETDVKGVFITVMLTAIKSLTWVNVKTQLYLLFCSYHQKAPI